MYAHVIIIRISYPDLTNLWKQQDKCAGVGWSHAAVTPACCVYGVALAGPIPVPCWLSPLLVIMLPGTSAKLTFFQCQEAAVHFETEAPPHEDRRMDRNVTPASVTTRRRGPRGLETWCSWLRNSPASGTRVAGCVSEFIGAA
jgi:hypothetical protein